MKGKKIIISVFITALVISVLLISLEAYYVAVALIVGVLLIGHRELWSLIKRRKLLPVDERVRQNVNKSVRNGFIFLVIVLAFLMLPFSVALTRTPGTEDVLSGLFLSTGAVYSLSYIFYERVEPGLSEKGLKIYKGLLISAGISLAVFIIGVFLHNAISGLFGVEEPVFFIITIISIGTFAIGLLGSLVFYIKGLCHRM